MYCWPHRFVSTAWLCFYWSSLLFLPCSVLSINSSSQVCFLGLSLSCYVVHCAQVVMFSVVCTWLGLSLVLCLLCMCVFCTAPCITMLYHVCLSCMLWSSEAVLGPPLVATTGALTASSVPDVTIGWPSVPRRGLSLPHQARALHQAPQTGNQSRENWWKTWKRRSKLGMMSRKGRKESY